GGMTGCGRRHLAGIVGVLAAMLVAAAPAAHGRVAALRSVPARTFVTDGPVWAVAPTAGAVYIGGSFTHVGPRTGAGVGIDASTGRNLRLPEIVGTVYAVAPDGSGGFYVGGAFTVVGGIARTNLAHVLADRSVDPTFDPGPNRIVRALAVSGSTLYAAGEFTSIGGQARNR